MLICHHEDEAMEQLQIVHVIERTLEKDVVAERARGHHRNQCSECLDRSYAHQLFLVHVAALVE